MRRLVIPTTRHPLVPLAAAVAVLALSTAAPAQTPRPFAPPAATTWAPVGCRTVPFADATSPARTTFRNLHSDGINSDEISTAVAPVLREAWTAEAATYNVTGPVFDSAGRLYFSPLLPYENVALISVDPGTGQRRWAVPGTGAPAGGGTPMVMADPDAPGSEIVYLGLYDRALAVRTDGTIVWDVPTGLTLGPDPFVNLVPGVNYLPGADAIAGLTGDGRVYFLDRRTGASLLPAPFSLPGEPSPVVPPALPQSLRDAADVLFRQLVNTPPGGLGRLTDTLLGNNIEVANFFSVDPRTNRLWIAATAPDAEDGTVDGVSELGALYRLDVSGGPGGLVVSEVCHASFAGGSASTPDVRGDGARVYVADNFGKVLAIDATDCSQIWEIAVGGQVVGSLGTSSDNGEIYASTLNNVVQIFDRGAQAQLGWTAALNVFQGLGPNELSFNLNLVTVGANGLAFQAGAGTILNGIPLAETLGVGVLDRATGAVRYFTGGGEETVAVMAVGPDGALYIGNSPVRRLFAQVLGLSPAPIRGGVTKFARERTDLLLRDAACAGEARARNALAVAEICPDAARADLGQIDELITQGRGATSEAVTAGDLSATRGSLYDRRLARTAERIAATQADPSARGLGRGLRATAARLRPICRAPILQ